MTRYQDVIGKKDIIILEDKVAGEKLECLKVQDMQEKVCIDRISIAGCFQKV